MSLPKLELSRNVKSKVISNRIKKRKEIKIHRTIWLQAVLSPRRQSNYLRQQAEILSRWSNLTPQRSKNIVNDFSVVSVVPKSLSTWSKLKQVGFTFPSLFYPRPASCSRQFTPSGSNFAKLFTAAEHKTNKWSHEVGLDRYLGTSVRESAKLLT